MYFVIKYLNDFLTSNIKLKLITISLAKCSDLIYNSISLLKQFINLLNPILFVRLRILFIQLNTIQLHKRKLQLRKVLVHLFPTLHY